MSAVERRERIGEKVRIGVWIERRREVVVVTVGRVDVAKLSRIRNCERRIVVYNQEALSTLRPDERERKLTM
jgi:siroheme synthase (precorrin-2 oxidase/ferrochelatase)